MANKHQFEQYLSAALTLRLARGGKVNAIANPYNDCLRILTDRMNEFNEKYICDKSGLRLDSILQFSMKMVKYAPLEGCCWQPLDEFLTKKEAIINI